MKVSVRGRHVELDNEVRDLAVEKVQHLDRYLDAIDRAEVYFFEDHTGRDDGHVCCEIIVVARGRFVRARARARSRRRRSSSRSTRPSTGSPG